MHENNVVGVVIFHLIGLLPTDHIILQWHTGVYEETFDLNIKMAQTVQSIWNFGKSTRVYWRNDYPEELTALGYCLWIVIVINLGKFTVTSHPLTCRCKVSVFCILNHPCKQNGRALLVISSHTLRGFNKHQRPMKRVSYFAQRSRPLFFLTEETTSLNNVLLKIEFVHVQRYVTW